MYTIACEDMGIPNCPFIGQAETMEGAMMELGSHGMTEHKAEIDQMLANGMTEQQMMEKMKSVAKMV